MSETTMQEIDRELKAMRKVAAALLRLAPNDRQRVMDALFLLYDVPRCAGAG